MCKIFFFLFFLSPYYSSNLKWFFQNVSALPHSVSKMQTNSICAWENVDKHIKISQIMALLIKTEENIKEQLMI